jgi:hypothetical protein
VAHAVSTSLRPPLPILWPERFGDHATLDKIIQASHTKIGTWEELEVERNRLIEDTDLPEEKKARIRAVFDINHPDLLLRVPSVHRYCRIGVAAAAASGQSWAKHYPDPDGVIRTANISDERLQGLELMMMYSLRRWEHHGRKVIVVDPATWDLLCNTELPPIPANELKHPFPSFYLMFPQGWAEFDIGPAPDGRPNLQPMEGVMVNLAKATLDPEDGEGTRHAELTLLVGGKSQKGWTDDNAVFLNWKLRPNYTIMDIHSPAAEKEMPVGGGTIGRTVPHAVFNFLLYLMTSHPHLEAVPPPRLPDVGKKKSAAKIRKLQQRNAKHSKLGYILLSGRGDKPKATAARGVGKPLQWQKPVKGHWRWQACGPKHSERELRLIEATTHRPDLPVRPTIAAAKVQRAQRREVDV